jgi:hypothetical protein
VGQAFLSFRYHGPNTAAPRLLYIQVCK